MTDPITRINIAPEAIWSRSQPEVPLVVLDLVRYAWRQSAMPLTLQTGMHGLSRRTTDGAGNTQPGERVENDRAYGHASRGDHAVTVTVSCIGPLICAGVCSHVEKSVVGVAERAPCGPRRGSGASGICLWRDAYGRGDGLRGVRFAHGPRTQRLSGVGRAELHPLPHACRGGPNRSHRAEPGPT